MKWVIFENGVMIKEKSTEKKGAKIFECPDPVVEAIVPEGVTSIGMEAFREMQDLRRVVLPDGIEEIQEGAFFGCANLMQVSLPESLTVIAMEAFEGCTSLRGITLPESLESIEHMAFANCNQLTALVVPEHTQIDAEIFGWYENSAKRLTILGAPEDLSILSEYKELKELHVEDLSAVPAAARAAAAAGFAAEKLPDLTSERAKAHLAYIKRNAPKLMARAFDTSELLRLMCREKLLPARCLEDYLKEADRRNATELASLLLDYQQNVLGKDALEKSRQRRVKKQETDADMVIEKSLARQRRTPEKGIAGLVFAVTGRLETVDKRDRVKDYLEIHGATLAGAITAKVDYLVTNDMDSGSEKNKKARELGIQVIDEKTFNRMTCRRFGDSEEIVVPGWVRSIEDWAFTACKSAKRIVLPEGLASIGACAFSSCKALETLELPDSVCEIKPSAFSSLSGCCERLREVRVSNGNGHFRSVDGVLFDKAGTTLVCYPAGREESAYSVPEGVTAIGSNAFYHCVRLMEITLPNGLTEIGSSAFGRCEDIRDLELPASIEKVGFYAFEGCTGLENLSIAGESVVFDAFAFGINSVLKLKTFRVKRWDSCLNELTKLWTVQTLYTQTPESVPLRFRSAVVSDGTSHTVGARPELPDNLEGLVFSVAGKLETFVDRDEIADYLKPYGASVASGLTKKVNYLVANAELSTDKADKASRYGIEVINETRFNELICRRFPDQEEVVVPAWVRHIAKGAFRNCKRLERVTLPEGLETIGDDAFSGCSSLRNIALPNGVREIGKYAFSECTGLEEIALPESLEAIGMCAFKHCEKLSELVLPASLGGKRFGFDALSLAGSLRAIRVVPNSPYLSAMDGVLYSKDGSRLIRYPSGRSEAVFHVPAQVKTIDKWAFSGSSLHGVELPEGLEEIGFSAFSGCSLLEKIIMPGSVKSVESNAFEKCAALKTIVMQGDVEELASDAFDECFYVKDLSVVHWNKGLDDYVGWPLKRIEAKYPESVPEAYRELVVKGEAGR